MVHPASSQRAFLEVDLRVQCVWTGANTHRHPRTTHLTIGPSCNVTESFELNTPKYLSSDP